MNEEIISKLQSYNFKVTSKGIIKKYSQRSKRYDVAGQINEAGVYFHAQNVSPFKQGQNTFKEIFGNNKPYTFTPIETEKVVDHSFTFSDYKKTTQNKNQFLIYLKAFNKQTIGKELKSNLYDVRGVKNGYFKDATLFPYINYENEFITAKIVKYNSNTGKRLKENYSNSWFHSEKSIKKSLGLKDKISKSVNCFFGEHLLNGNDKPVVIVEAEKTAIILSLVYTNTVFIASGGLAKLKGLDWSFLADRQVYLFPDNNASEWFEIASNRGWWVSDILENEAAPGQDAADYITTYKSNDQNAEIWWQLHEQLWSIDNKELSSKDSNTYCLGFENKKKLSFNYSLPIPKELELNTYFDTSKGKIFKGKHFHVFENDFKVLNANIDFNKSYKTEFGWQQMNASQFIKNLEKCFRLVKHLNSKKDYTRLFSKVLLNILLNSNHTFNIGYVERVLIPFWDNDTNEIEKYYKFRNWRFASADVIEKKDFIKTLNNDQKLFTTNQFLIKLQPLLNKKEFILTEVIGLHHKVGNEYVWSLIQKYNTEVLGCKTLKGYQSKLKVSKYLNWWAKNVNKLENETKLYIKFDSTYYNTNIDCQEKCTIYKIPPISVINENTGVHRKLINEYFSFKPEANILDNLIFEIGQYISNPQSFTFERVNGRIVATPEPIKENNTQILLSTAEAFSDPLDLTNSVLNISEAEAMKRDTNFLTSWIYFNNPKLTEIERDNIRQCPMLFFKPKTSELLRAS